MQLNITEESLDEVPLQFHELYSPDGDKFKLTAIKDLKTIQDVAAVQEANRKEKENHKETKARLAAYTEINPDPTAIAEQLLKIAELEAAGSVKTDDEKINAVTEVKINAAVKPLEAEKVRLQADLDAARNTIANYDLEKRQRKLKDDTIGALDKAKITQPEHREHALLLAKEQLTLNDDFETVTKEGVTGVTAYLSPDLWLSEKQSTHPSWFGINQGGGSQGSNAGINGGANPWNPKTLNRTEQARLYSDPAMKSKAKQMAAQYGVVLP
jgi:hypothetical protein